MERVVPSVVMIRSYAPRAFDGKGAGSSYATGFVVDAENGIILTNRHVVRTGPIVAEAILQNNEEIALTPIYRDPVHDFGFLQYDPEDIRFQTMHALPLKPTHARQGTEVRLIGSDAGEKVSILSGILARLDRRAPNYGADNYNDFNTFYLQAASGSSGGSSGSPVVDIHGHVIALNAGSNRKAASSFFLPLDRMVHALERIQGGEAVSRGTVHTTFVHRTFDEAARFGLSDVAEAEIRGADPEATGVLVVERVLVEGAADGKLVAGDVLLKVGGERIDKFIPLEALLDAHVGRDLEFEIERGEAALQLTLSVADLDAVTPKEFVEIGNSVFHAYSYQMARHHEVAAKGIFVADRGYMMSRKIAYGSVITHVNGNRVENLTSFADALAAIPERQPFTVRSFHPNAPRRTRTAVLRMDRRWFPAQRCRRDDGARWWACQALPKPEQQSFEAITAMPQKVAGKRAQRLAAGMVTINFEIPYRTDGVYGSSFSGLGIIVDAEKGLVLADRDTVTVGLGDVTLTFADSVETIAEVVALHPIHNLALVQYDPESIGDTKAVAIRFDGGPMKAGQKVFHIGRTPQGRLEAETTTIADIRPVSLPLPMVPFFRQANLELVHTKGNRTGFMGGVLTDKAGRVSALWACFPNHGNEDAQDWWLGIPAATVNDFIRDPSGSHTLGVEWGIATLTDARKRGLSPSIALEVEGHDPWSRQLLEVQRITNGGPADGVLLEGDLLIRVNGDMVTRFSQYEDAAGEDEVSLTVLRDGAVETLALSPEFVSSIATSRLLMWGGALFQDPHRAIAQQRGQPTDGAYVSYWWRGSPAGRYGLRPMRRVVAVDGVEVANLDDFADAVKGKQDGEATRLLTIDLQGRKRMVTMQADNHYWPLVEIKRTEKGWVRQPFSDGIEN